MSYEKKDGKVFYCSTKKRTLVENVDFKSFQEIHKNFGLDNNSVFKKHKAFKQIDRGSFFQVQKKFAFDKKYFYSLDDDHKIKLPKENIGNPKKIIRRSHNDFLIITSQSAFWADHRGFLKLDSKNDFNFDFIEDTYYFKNKTQVFFKGKVLADIPPEDIIKIEGSELVCRSKLIIYGEPCELDFGSYTHIPEEYAITDNQIISFYEYNTPQAEVIKIQFKDNQDQDYSPLLTDLRRLYKNQEEQFQPHTFDTNKKTKPSSWKIAIDTEGIFLVKEKIKKKLDIESLDLFFSQITQCDQNKDWKHLLIYYNGGFSNGFIFPDRLSDQGYKSLALIYNKMYECGHSDAVTQSCEFLSLSTHEDSNRGRDQNFAKSFLSHLNPDLYEYFKVKCLYLDDLNSTTFTKMTKVLTADKYVYSTDPIQRLRSLVALQVTVIATENTHLFCKNLLSDLLNLFKEEPDKRVKCQILKILTICAHYRFGLSCADCIKKFKIDTGIFYPMIKEVYKILLDEKINIPYVKESQKEVDEFFR